MYLYVFYCVLYCLYCVCVVSFMYIYSSLFLVQGLLPPSENSVAVNNNNNNNNNTPHKGDDDDDDDDDNNNNNKPKVYYVRTYVARYYVRILYTVMFEIFDIHNFRTTIVETFTYDLSLHKLYACSNSGQFLVL